MSFPASIIAEPAVVTSWKRGGRLFPGELFEMYCTSLILKHFMQWLVYTKCPMTGQNSPHFSPGGSQWDLNGSS